VEIRAHLLNEVLDFGLPQPGRGAEQPQREIQLVGWIRAVPN
jgi:hypothetical protein